MNKKMKKQLIELLNIHGVSGDEGKVRDYLTPIMEDLMDVATIDKKGNLLCEKKYGNGEGATILLSAHMDTVKGVEKDRKLMIDDDVIGSDKGALGADDRAGITIILEVIRNLKNINFNGNVKVAFCVEEEIGCRGSSKIDSTFYNNVDLAIVVDRRGNRDIVVGCGMAFCSDAVGIFLEEVSQMADMDWKAVEGGISDAMTFAENGVNSVNLSAGYYNEHTKFEYVSVSQMVDTAKLILQAFAVINDYMTINGDFGYVPQENKWVQAWGVGASRGSWYDEYEDFYMDSVENVDLADDIWVEQPTKHGDVYVYQVDDTCIIQQDDKEILMSKDDLKCLLAQLQ